MDEMNAADIFGYANILATVVAGLVLESLRRFSNRLSSLERMDNEVRVEVRKIEATMKTDMAQSELQHAKTYVSREELNERHKEMRLDAVRDHTQLMDRLNGISATLEKRLDRLESRIAATETAGRVS